MSTPEERFVEWWQTVPCEYTDVVNEDVARAAYLAATEDAAKIRKPSRSAERYARFLEYGDGFDSFIDFCRWDATRRAT